MLCALFALPARAGAAPLRVAVLLSDSGGAYREFAGSLSENLEPHLAVQILEAGDTDFVADLVVAVGMKAAAAQAATQQATLSVLVPRAGFERLSRLSSPAFAAIYMEQPMERQLALLAAVLPDVEDVGVLYATPPAELENLRKLAAKRFTLHEQTVATPSNLSGALNDLLGESEVLFVLPDAAVYNSDTIRNILLETYRKQIPMIGISPGYVRAGALCAVYSSPQQIAQQAAAVIGQWALSGKLPASQYPKEFEVQVNTQVARSLGLTLKDAVQLRAEVRRKQ